MKRIISILIIGVIVFSLSACGMQFNAFNSRGESPLIPVPDEDGIWGYIDASGAFEISPQYKRAYQFADNGLALVQDMDISMSPEIMPSNRSIIRNTSFRAMDWHVSWTRIRIYME